MHTRFPLWMALGLALLGCGPPTWQEAAKANNADVYEAFARDNPQLRHAEVALQRAKRLRWDQANEVGAAADWAAYLRLDNTGDRADVARAAYESASFEDAMAAGDSVSIERFVQQFPQSAHAAEATKVMDDRFWNEARDEDTATAYRRYLLRMPKGKYREQAEFNQEGRVWERTTDDDTVRAYRKYLQSHHTGVNADRCRERIDQLTFKTVRVGIALADSIHPDRAKTMASLKKWAPDEVKSGFKAMGFEISVVDVEDVGPGRDGRGIFEIPAGEGLLLVDIREEAGQAFEPSGTGTLIKGELRLYVAEREQPLYIAEIQAQTGDSVSWGDISGLQGNAHVQLGAEISQQAGRLVQWQKK